MKKVIVYGNTLLSKMLFYDAQNRQDFQIVGFTVQQKYLDSSTFLGLPLVDFETVRAYFPPHKYDMVAVLGGYSCMRNKIILYNEAKKKGYILRNYISERVDIAPDVVMGDNNLIFGPTHVGLSGQLGNNNVIRQNVYLGHDFHIGHHNFIGAGATIGGNCSIKNTSYIGLGATIINNTNLADETLIGAGSVVIKHTQAYSRNVGNPSRLIGYHEEEGIRLHEHHE